MGVRKIDIGGTTRKIAGLFRETLPELLEDARLVELTKDDFVRLNKCRCNIGNISIANSLVTSFFMPESADETDDKACYIMVSGNFTLLPNDNLTEIVQSPLWVYPWASFFTPRLKKSVGTDEINQYIWPFAQSEGKVDQSELLNMFTPYTVYRVLTPIEDDDDLRFIVFMAYLDQPDYHRLSFSESLVKEFKDSLSDPDPDIGTLFNAISADRWENCFFALYQCLEPLFNNLLAKTLKAALSISEEKIILKLQKSYGKTHCLFQMKNM